jgi:putative hydrolase of the HAD superfamily
VRSAVLFDLDCTLTDRPASIRQFAYRIAGTFAKELRECDPSRIYEVILAADDLGYAPRSLVCEALATRLDWIHSPQTAQLVQFWRSNFPECTVAREGAFETLCALRAREHKLAIVSNGNTRTQRRKIEVLKIADLLDAILISDEVGCRKPDAAIFRLALRGIGAADAWFVGDHPRNDVEGARQNGLRAVWLKGVHPWPADLSPPEYSIERLDELLSLLASS